MYEPAEDSYLLVESIKKYFRNKKKLDKALDMGVGSGVIASELLNHVKEVHVADIDKDVIAYIKEIKPALTVYTSNLFDNVPNQQEYDVITFNAPYLPGKRNKETIDLVGGLEGVELSVEFLRQATNFLKKEGVIFLVASSHSKLDVLIMKVRELGFIIEEFDKIHVFFEDIIVYVITWK